MMLGSLLETIIIFLMGRNFGSLDDGMTSSHHAWVVVENNNNLPNGWQFGWQF